MQRATTKHLEVITMKLAHSIKIVGFLAAFLAVLTLAVPSYSWAHDGWYGRGYSNGYYGNGGYWHRHHHYWDNGYRHHRYWDRGYGYYPYQRSYYSPPVFSVGVPGFSLSIWQ